MFILYEECTLLMILHSSRLFSSRNRHRKSYRSTVSVLRRMVVYNRRACKISSWNGKRLSCLWSIWYYITLHV